MQGLEAILILVHMGLLALLPGLLVVSMLLERFARMQRVRIRALESNLSDIDEVPAALWIESGIDGAVVHLGPRGRGRGTIVLLGLTVIAAGSAAVLYLGWLLSCMALLVCGSAVVLVDGYRSWARYDAPLEVGFEPHRLVLRRVFRTRLLFEESFSWDEVVDATATGTGFDLELSSERRQIELGHRTWPEIEWVVTQIRERRHTPDEAEADERDRLARLMGERSTAAGEGR